MNSRSGDSENESVSQFFHILGSVEQQRGCCEVADGKYEITYIRHAGMLQKEYIIIQHMKTVRFQLLI